MLPLLDHATVYAMYLCFTFGQRQHLSFVVESLSETFPSRLELDRSIAPTRPKMPHYASPPIVKKTSSQREELPPRPFKNPPISAYFWDLVWTYEMAAAVPENLGSRYDSSVRR